MARLVVEAAAESNNVLAGTTSPVNIYLSVTDHTGTPVTGLPKKWFGGFKLHNLTASLGPTIELKYVANHPSGTGFYRLQVAPTGTHSWVAGFTLSASLCHTTRYSCQFHFFPATTGKHSQASQSLVRTPDQAAKEAGQQVNHRSAAMTDLNEKELKPRHRPCSRLRPSHAAPKESKPL
jgi:hypothetical protein